MILSELTNGYCVRIGVNETMDQSQGAEEDQEQDAAAKYFEFAEQFLALSDDEMDDATEAAAAASFLDLMDIAASVEEDAEISEGEETPAAVWGGSLPGKAPNKNRDFMGAHAKLVEHYFSGTESLYNETDFERRFRMPRSVFNRIHEALVQEEVDPFVQKYCSVTKKPGISPLCRLVACLRKICYGDTQMIAKMSTYSSVKHQ